MADILAQIKRLESELEGFDFGDEPDSPEVGSNGPKQSASSPVSAMSGPNIPDGTLAFRNNNPGNLRFVGQAGASQGEGGFANFDTPGAGQGALGKQVSLDASRGHTIGSFIEKYAPPSENDTKGYIDFITSETGMNKDDLLSNVDHGKISRAMAEFESGTTFGDTTQPKIVPADQREPLRDPGNSVEKMLKEVELDRTRQETREGMKDRGFGGELLTAPARGAVGAAEMLIRATRAGQDKPGEDVGWYDKFATDKLEWIKRYQAATPAQQSNYEGGVLGAISEGTSSAITSIIAGVPGALAGAVAGSALPWIGTVLGGIIGFATSSGVQFGVGQYDQVLEMADAEGISREKSERAAIMSGLHEGGWEFASDMVGAKILGLTGKALSPIGKAALKDGIASTFKKSWKQIGKEAAGVMGVETGSELLTAGFQSDIETGIGLGDRTFWEGAKDAFGPAFVASVIFAGIGAGGAGMRRGSIKKSLTDPEADIGKRLTAAKEVRDTLKGTDSDIADVWFDSAIDSIQNGEAIKLDTDVVDQADQQKKEAERVKSNLANNTKINDVDPLDPKNNDEFLSNYIANESLVGAESEQFGDFLGVEIMAKEDDEEYWREAEQRIQEQKGQADFQKGLVNGKTISPEGITEADDLIQAFSQPRKSFGDRITEAEQLEIRGQFQKMIEDGLPVADGLERLEQYLTDRVRDKSATALEKRQADMAGNTPDNYNFQRALEGGPDESQLPLPGDIPGFQRGLDREGQKPFTGLADKMKPKGPKAITADVGTGQGTVDDGIDVGEADFESEAVHDQRAFQKGLTDNFGMQDLSAEQNAGRKPIFKNAPKDQKKHDSLYQKIKETFAKLSLEDRQFYDKGLGIGIEAGNSPLDWLKSGAIKQKGHDKSMGWGLVGEDFREAVYDYTQYMEGREAEDSVKPKKSKISEPKPKEKKPDKPKAPLKVGDKIKVGQLGDAVLTDKETIDGVDYELYSPEDPLNYKGAVRVYDADSGEVVSLTIYPDIKTAIEKFNEAVGINKPEETDKKPEWKKEPVLGNKFAWRLGDKILILDKRNLREDLRGFWLNSLDGVRDIGELFVKKFDTLPEAKAFAESHTKAQLDKMVQKSPDKEKSKKEKLEQIVKTQFNDDWKGNIFKVRQAANAIHKAGFSTPELEAAKGDDAAIEIAVQNILDKHGIVAPGQKETNQKVIEAKAIEDHVNALISSDIARGKKDGREATPEQIKEYTKYLTKNTQDFVNAINNREFGLLTDMLHRGNKRTLKLFTKLTGLSTKTQKVTDENIRSLDPAKYDAWKNSNKQAFEDKQKEKEKAREAKAEKDMLETKVDYLGETMTFEKFINTLLEDGYTDLVKKEDGPFPSVKLVKKTDKDPRSFSTRAFKKKLEIAYIERVHGKYIDKMVADDTALEEKDRAENPDNYVTDEQADHLFGKDTQKEKFVLFFEAEFMDGTNFKNIAAARKKLTDAHGIPVIKPGTTESKMVDEAIEAAAVNFARMVIEASRKAKLSNEAIFDRLVKIQDQMPNLSVRTSTSVRDQAYSTPLGLAFVASELAGITQDTSVYEPSAGNGALVIGADRKKTVVNEMNPDRAANLESQGFQHVYKRDGTQIDMVSKRDVVIGNPPFGAVKDDDGNSKTWNIMGLYDTTQIDHAMVFKALESMKVKGKAVFIVGSVNDKNTKESIRKQLYRAKNKVQFYKALYDEYNVVDHFSVSGKLYAKQGAAWPVDIIVIDGKGKSKLTLPGAVPPPYLSTMDQVKGKLNENVSVDNARDGQTGADSGSDQVSPGEPTGDNGRNPSLADDGQASGSDQPGTGPGSGGKEPGGKTGGTGDIVGDGGKVNEDGGKGSTPGESTISGLPGPVGDNATEGNNNQDGPKGRRDTGRGKRDGTDTIPGQPDSSIEDELANTSEAELDAMLDDAFGEDIKLPQSIQEELTGMSDGDIDSLLDEVFDESPKEEKPNKPPKPTLPQLTDAAKMRRENQKAMERSPLARRILNQKAIKKWVRDQKRKEKNKNKPPLPPKNPKDLLDDIALDSLSGVKNAVKGLGALFTPRNTLSSGFIFNEETYAAAKKYFVEAWTDAKKVGQSLKQLVQYLAKQFGAEIKPYLKRFLIDQSNEEKKPKPPKKKEVTGTDMQTPYTPSSGSSPIGTLTPVNMSASIKKALETFVEDHGPIDEYVGEKLGYTKEEMLGKDGNFGYFSGEQMDAIALAIGNIENGAGFIIGDQTGVGKGRVVAAMLRFAMRNNLTPIFVTEKANLYADMYRDFTDIGMADIADRILVTNNNFKIPITKDRSKWLKTKPGHNKILEKMIDDGKLSDDYDVIFTTYDQMNRTASMRRTFLERMTEGNGMLVMDEAHNAGGSAGNMETPEKLPRSIWMRRVLNTAQGAFYSSATYAKRPDVMSLYSHTDMKLAVDDIEDLAGAIQAGGVPLQQATASMLVEGGQMMRRERSYEGVPYNTQTVSVDKKSTESLSIGYKEVFDFSNTYIAAAMDNLGNAGAAGGISVAGGQTAGGGALSTTGFSSVMHHLIAQASLSLKIESSIEQAIKAHKDGEKPIITMSYTMGSFIKEYAKDNELQPGDGIGLKFNDLLFNYLDKTRKYTEKQPYARGPGIPHYITDAELGEEGVREYKRIKKWIFDLDLGNMPVSPVDYITQRLEAEGIRVGELTGRDDRIEYREDGTQRYRRRTGKEKTIAARLQTINDFNSDNIDAMILNRSGSTGLSLHALPQWEGHDPAPRKMIILQAEANIDTHMQILGRIHRAGQKKKPSYVQLMGDIPIEKRPAAVLAGKMASLNANTTASKDSDMTAKDVVDFINKYGDRVVANLMADFREIHRAFGRPLQTSDHTESGLVEMGASRKISGRIPLLPSLKQQEEIYALIEAEYKSLIERLDASGQNDLEAKTYNIDAKTLQTATVFEGDPNSTSPFTSPAIAEIVDMKKIGKSYTSKEVTTLLKESIFGMKSREAMDTEKSLDEIHDETMDKQRKSGTEAMGLFNDYSSSILDDIEKEERRRAVEARLNANLHDWTRIFQAAIPGSVLEIPINGIYFDTVVLSVEQTGTPTNPLALGTWRATVAVPDSTKRLTLPFSFINRMESFSNNGAVSESALAKFDRASQEAREQRTIITGNLLASYGQYRRGRIINFTDDAKKVRQGILMPVDFDLGAAAAEKRVVLNTAENVDIVLANGIFVKSRRGDLTITPNSGNYIVSVAGSRAKGGKYFLNQGLTAITGDFVRSSNRYRVTISDSKTLKKTLDYLISNMDEVFENAIDSDRVRDLLGIELPTFTGRSEAAPQLSTSQDTNQTNAQGFKRAIRKNKEELYNIILDAADSGPFDGGCVIAAEGIQGAIGGEVVVLVRKDGTADHAAVSLGGKLYDFDGPLGKKAFLNRFNKNEMAETVDVRPIKETDLPDSPRDKEAAASISKILKADTSDTKYQANQTPGSGVSLKDIQSVFKGQDVFISPDGSISVRYKNGSGVRIISTNKMSNGDTQFAIESGRMDGKGIIMGKAVGSEITLNKDYADKKTLWHELEHTLVNAGILTQKDLKVLSARFLKLTRAGKSKYKTNQSKDKNIARQEDQANAFSQLLSDREEYRGTRLGNILQKIADFLDGLLHIGRQSARKLAREVETGNIFERSFNQGQTVDGKALFATQDPTNTRSKSFKDWFGRSVARVKNQPVMFYHGTPEQFTVFDKKKAGGSTKHGSAGLGHFFTVKKAKAKHYAGDKGNFIQAYLKMEKPYVMTLKEIQSFEKLQDSIDRQAQLEAEGYDSIIVPTEQTGDEPIVTVFNSNQIKSIHNTGEWDSSNPDIRFQTTDDLVDDMADIPDNSTLSEDIKYNVVNMLSPIDKVYEAVGKDIPERDDFKLAEELRTSKAKGGIDHAEEKYFEPIKKLIAKFKLTVAMVDEFLYARHVPEANARLRLTNARFYLDKVARIQKGKKLANRIAKLDAQFELEQFPTQEIQESYKMILEEELTLETIQAHIDEAQEKLEKAELTEDEKKIAFAQGQLSRAKAELKVKADWEEFSAKPSGMTDGYQDSRDNEAADLNKKWADDEGMEAIAKIFDSMTDEGLRISHEAGRLSDEEYAAVKGTFDHYAPLYREGMETKRAFEGIGSGVKNLGSDVKTRGGSTKRAVHLLANAITNHEKTIISAKKAEVTKAFYNFVKANPNKDFWWFEETKTRAKYDGQGHIERVIDRNIDDQKDGSQVKIKVDGKTHVISVNKNNTHAVRILNTIRGSGHQSGPIVNALGRLNRMLATVNTTWNPEFLFSNFSRDLGTAFYNLEDTDVKGVKKQIFKDIPKALMGLRSAMRGDGSHEWAKIVSQYEKSGAKIGWIDYGKDIESRAKKLESQIDLFREGHITKKSLRNLLTFVEDYNSIVENAVRLSTFKAGIDAGMTEAKAAIMAKGLTVNFNQKGAMGPVVNSLYLFANAGIQGSVRIITAMKNNPKKMAKLLGGTTLAAAMLSIANGSIGGDDDDGVPYYDKIDTWLKARNMIFMLPGTKGKFVKIPLPWGYNVFWAMGTEVGDGLTQKGYDPLDGVSRTLMTGLDAFNPLQSATLAQTVSPTILDPFIKSGENKTFSGAPLMPELNMFDKTPTPDSERYWRSVSPMSKVIAKGLSRGTGGNKIKPGAIDISPETLDLVWETFTGGSGRFVADTFSLPIRAVSGDLGMRKTPFVRRFFGEKSEYKTSSDYRENVSHVYELMEQGKMYPEKRKSLKKDKTYFLLSAAKLSDKKLKTLNKVLKRSKTKADQDRIKKRMEKVRNDFNKKFITRKAL